MPTDVTTYNNTCMPVYMYRTTPIGYLPTWLKCSRKYLINVYCTYKSPNGHTLTYNVWHTVGSQHYVQHVKSKSRGESEDVCLWLDICTLHVDTACTDKQVRYRTVNTVAPREQCVKICTSLPVPVLLVRIILIRILTQRFTCTKQERILRGSESWK